MHSRTSGIRSQAGSPGVNKLGAPKLAAVTSQNGKRSTDGRYQTTQQRRLLYVGPQKTAASLQSSKATNRSAVYIYEDLGNLQGLIVQGSAQPQMHVDMRRATALAK